MTSADDRTAALRARVRDGVARLEGDLEDLVRIPSVSAPTFDQSHVRRSAEAVAALLRDVGLPEVEILAVPGGGPAVVGRRPAADGAPTVMLYAHHDVQPPGPRESWSSDPFEPRRRGERLFGRGAADDKAGVVAHVGALRALAASSPVGVTVFVEGEEEIGSPTFGTFLSTYRDRLAVDVVVVADSSLWKVGVPALTTSLRGLVDLEVEVEVLDHAVHSGMFGGPVVDAVTVLARVLATLHDDAGDVAVAGLVRGPDPAVDHDEHDLRAEAGVLDGVRLTGTGPISARLWTRPAISVIGIDATSVAESSNTILPRARARLSVRIAPGQDPQQALDAVRAHVLEHTPWGARVTVLDGTRGRAFAAPQDSEAMRAARWAFAQAWGTDPVDIGVGGSIPFVADLLEAMPDAAVLVTGVEDPDSRAHGADESVHLGELEKVVLAEALLLDRLGRAGA